jgi:endo-1,4-beta-xylanase
MMRIKAVTSDRRAVLSLGSGLAAACLAGSSDAAEEPGLGTKAAERGLIFGAAVQGESLRKDTAYRNAIIRECGVIVPEWEMKWGEIEKAKGRTDYRRADWLATFAAEHGMELRGHTAVWWNNLPAWVKDALPKEGGRALYRDHVRSMLAHFGDRVSSWDVVNEAIEPKDGRADGLRQSDFLKAFGPDHIAEAFRIARDAAPKASLYYNDYGLEYVGRLEDARRESTLRLLSDLKSRGAPIDGLGIQSHLKVGNRFDPQRFRDFLSAVADLGLRILISEFDVSDVRLAPDVEARDRAVAGHAASFLEVAFDEPKVVGLITWGLSDRYSWLNSGPMARKDKLPTRALPLDKDMRRKPLWHQIARSVASAPERLRG